jgi:uncharacterized protein with HEPN domain
VNRSEQELVADALQHLEVLAFHLDQGGFENQTLIDAICLRLAAAIDSISKTSPEFRERHFGSDWGAIRATRNRIVHGYAFINWDTIRSTIVNDLPAFRTELKRALA